MGALLTYDKAVMAISPIAVFASVGTFNSYKYSEETRIEKLTDQNRYNLMSLTSVGEKLRSWR